jgi:hypothetical protein
MCLLQLRLAGRMPELHFKWLHSESNILLLQSLVSGQLPLLLLLLQCPIRVHCFLFISRVSPHVFEMPSRRSLYPCLQLKHSSSLVRVPGTLWFRHSVQCRSMLV